MEDKMKHRARWSTVTIPLAVIVALALAAAGVAVAQPAPPSTLTGESFHQDTPTITSVDCNESANYTYSYFATGTATGPYPGTFTETGTLIFNRLEASFTIDSAAGQVTGTKTANVGVSCAGGPPCSGAEACSDEGASYNTDPSGFSGTDRYEATIRTASGAFADNGLFTAVFYRSDPPPSPLNGFNSDFLSALASPVPLGPTTKDQCKNGGWRDFPEFKNQGQCIAFVDHGP
jgi:hypothetical protein